MVRRTRPGKQRSPINPYDGGDVAPDEAELDGLSFGSVDSTENRPRDEGWGEDGNGDRSTLDKSKAEVVDPSTYLDE